MLGRDVCSCLDVCSRPMDDTFLYCCPRYCEVSSLMLEREQKSRFPWASVRARKWHGPGTDVHGVLGALLM